MPGQSQPESAASARPYGAGASVAFTGHEVVMLAGRHILSGSTAVGPKR